MPSQQVTSLFRERGGELIEPEAITGNLTRAKPSAEILLVRAVLLDGLSHAVGMHVLTEAKPGAGWRIRYDRTRQCKLRDMERRWVLDDEDVPFSFVWCCRHLGLDADAVREATLRVHPTSARDLLARAQHAHQASATGS